MLQQQVKEETKAKYDSYKNTKVVIKVSNFGPWTFEHMDFVQMDGKKNISLHLANAYLILSFFLIAQSFIQVGLDGIQEVWRVDIMFIQLTPAR